MPIERSASRRLQAESNPPPGDPSLPDASLPLAAYGLFAANQVGILCLGEHIADLLCNVELPGILYERDGLPLLVAEEGSQRALGDLIFFRDGLSQSAYETIAGLEPRHQYRWGMVGIEANGRAYKANVLFGRSPEKGSVEFGGVRWNVRSDPLFSDAFFHTIDEIIEKHAACDQDYRSLFHIEMAYTLLWSSIERYLAFRYGLSDQVMKRIRKFGDDPNFQEAFSRLVKEERRIVRSDRPVDTVKLNPDKPNLAVRYYYQMRSNAIHRGKAAATDFDALRSSLIELRKIFQDVLEQAFEDASRLTSRLTRQTGEPAPRPSAGDPRGYTARRCAPRSRKRT